MLDSTIQKRYQTPANVIAIAVTFTICIVGVVFDAYQPRSYLNVCAFGVCQIGDNVGEECTINPVSQWLGFVTFLINTLLAISSIIAMVLLYRTVRRNLQANAKYDFRGNDRRPCRHRTIMGGTTATIMNHPEIPSSTFTTTRREDDHHNPQPLQHNEEDDVNHNDDGNDGNVTSLIVADIDANINDDSNNHNHSDISTRRDDTNRSSNSTRTTSIMFVTRLSAGMKKIREQHRENQHQQQRQQQQRHDINRSRIM